LEEFMNHLVSLSSLPRAAACAVLAISPCAMAQTEPFAFVDQFNQVEPLNGDLWMGSEITRLVMNKQLYLGLGTTGGVDKDTGLKLGAQSLALAESQSVTALAADVAMHYLWVPGCGANRSVAYGQMTLGGGFFNVGTPVVNSAVGDVQAWVRFERRSDATTAEGTASAEGLVVQCRNKLCNLYTTLGSVSLGTLAVGEKDKFHIIWDKAAKSFGFRRGLRGVTQAVTYTVPDSLAATRPAKYFGIRNAAAHCASEGRLVTKTVTRIDNVAVNESALP
jgi:hypothetical protein